MSYYLCMKLSEIDNYELLATKLDVEKLKSDLQAKIYESERAQRFWIWGLYVVIILSHFWK
jgi:hypothetical protein